MKRLVLIFVGAAVLLSTWSCQKKESGQEKSKQASTVSSQAPRLPSDIPEPDTQPCSWDTQTPAQNENEVPKFFFEDSGQAFACMGPYRNKPWIKDALMKAMEPEPYWALVFYFQYADKSWAPEVFLTSVKLAPSSAFYFFSARTGFNGNHDPAWYEQRVPGLMRLLRTEVESAVSKSNGVRALEFLLKERDFPDRKSLLERIVPELVMWEEDQYYTSIDMMKTLRGMEEPYAVEAVEYLKRDAVIRYQYMRRVLAGP